MATIKDIALAYEPQQTKNIAELDYVPVELELVESTHKNSAGEDFTVKTATVDGEKYRVPNSVLEQLKGILTKFPDSKYFCVSKSGNGMSTKYQVMPHSGKVKEEKVK